MKQFQGYYVRTDKGINGIFSVPLEKGQYLIGSTLINEKDLDVIYLENEMIIWELDTIDKSINQHRVTSYNIKTQQYFVNNCFRYIDLKKAIYSLDEAKEKHRLLIIDEIRKLLTYLIEPSIYIASE
jgi:hypothetical protein